MPNCQSKAVMAN